MCKTSPYKIIYKYTRVSKVKICHKTSAREKREYPFPVGKNNRETLDNCFSFHKKFWFGAPNKFKYVSKRKKKLKKTV